MSQVSENDIHEIVVRVVRQTLGASASAGGALSGRLTDKPTTPLPFAEKPETQPSIEKRVVAIGTDHGGVELKKVLIQEISHMGFKIMDCGTNTSDPVDYPDIALAVAQQVAQGAAWRGVVIDGAGIGSCMAANKVPGVRAALCYDYATAVNSREHNDANVLTLGAGLIGVNLAKQVLKTWLTTEFGGGRHVRRVDKIMEIEKKYLGRKTA